jgi:hypothetical protein
LHELNEFDVKNMSWKMQPLQIERKFHNFHQCPFFITTKQYPEAILSKLVIKTIAKLFNAKAMNTPDVDFEMAYLHHEKASGPSFSGDYCKIIKGFQ